MPNPYPAAFTDPEGGVRLSGDVVFTDPANQPGGSQPGVAVEYAVPFSFDDPDILTGITLFECVAGQRIGNVGIAVLEAFDGTSPSGAIGISGESLGDGTDAYCTADMTVADPFYDDSQGLENVRKPDTNMTLDEGLYVVAAATLVVLVSDGAGGDPNNPTPMSAGQAIARFQIIEPATP